MGYQLYDDPDKEAEAFFKANARMPESMEKFEYDLNGLHFRAYCVNNLEYYDRTKGSDEEPQNLSLLYLVFSEHVVVKSGMNTFSPYCLTV